MTDKLINEIKLELERYLEDIVYYLDFVSHLKHKDKADMGVICGLECIKHITEDNIKYL